MNDQEEVPMEIKGHTGTVDFDGDFVTIKRTGFLARASVGKGEKRIPLGSLTAVQWKPAGPMVNGFIQFTVAGGVESRSRLGSQTTDAGRDENSVLFTKKQMPGFQALRAEIEEAMAHRAPPATASSQSNDPVEQLRQLAALREQGIISDAEFEAKRVQLLGRM
jgi:hypothetical protein